MINRKLILIIFQNSKLFKIFILLNASNSLSSNFSLPKKFVYFKFKIPNIQNFNPLKIRTPFYETWSCFSSSDDRPKFLPH